MVGHYDQLEMSPQPSPGLHQDQGQWPGEDNYVGMVRIIRGLYSRI